MYLIICVGDSYKYTQIVLKYEYKLGAQLPLTVYSKLFFADQNWKEPIRADYMQSLALYRPTIATVLDLEREDQYKTVLNWAEEASQYTENVVIIPKYNGVISKLPRTINNKRVILGYSVPTKYAGTTVPVDEFRGWPIHLLGGSPYQHLLLCKQLGSDIISIDCNFHLKMANRYCQFFSEVPVFYARNSDWPTLKEVDNKKFGTSGPVEAFRRSCENILKFWRLHGFRITV